MDNLVLEGPSTDLPFFEYLRDEGADVKIARTNNLEGLGEIIHATLPLKDIIVPVIVAYIVSMRGRSVTVNNEKLIFKGYNLKEIVATLKKLFDDSKE